MGLLEVHPVRRRITVTIDTEYPSGKVRRVSETFDEVKLATMKNPVRYLLDIINKLLKLSKETPT